MSTKRRPRPISWDTLRVFLAVVRGRTLTAAARSLDLSQPKVSEDIARLEKALGVTLFTRSRKGLVPTRAAASTLAYATSMEELAMSLARAGTTTAAPEEGTVRIQAAQGLGHDVVAPMVSDLRAAYPRLALEVNFTRGDVPLARTDDISLRTSAPTQKQIVGDHVGTRKTGLFATSAYLAKHPPPETSADLLRNHALVGWDEATWMSTPLADAGVVLKRQDFALRSDDESFQRAAVRSGAGIGVYPLDLAARPPKLRRVLPAIEIAQPLWVVMHEDLQASRRAMLVYEHFVKSLKTEYAGR